MKTVNIMKTPSALVSRVRVCVLNINASLASFVRKVVFIGFLLLFFQKKRDEKTLRSFHFSESRYKTLLLSSYYSFLLKRCGSYRRSEKNASREKCNTRKTAKILQSRSWRLPTVCKRTSTTSSDVRVQCSSFGYCEHLICWIKISSLTIVTRHNFEHRFFVCYRNTLTLSQTHGLPLQTWDFLRKPAEILGKWRIHTHMYNGMAYGKAVE